MSGLKHFIFLKTFIHFFYSFLFYFFKDKNLDQFLIVC